MNRGVFDGVPWQVLLFGGVFVFFFLALAIFNRSIVRRDEPDATFIDVAERGLESHPVPQSIARWRPLITWVVLLLILGTSVLFCVLMPFEQELS